MKKLFKIIMGFMYAIIGLLMISTIGILCYSQFGNGSSSTSNKPQYELSKEDEVIETDDKPNSDNEDIVISSDDSQEEELITLNENPIDEDIALEKVIAFLNYLEPSEILVEGLTQIKGEYYYTFSLKEGEGDFYVSQDTGELFTIHGDTGEFASLENYEMPELFETKDEEKRKGEKFAIINNCLDLENFYHGMSFRDAMNVVLKRADINEDILEYDKVVYNTVSYNSELGHRGIYNNLEIASIMGDYYFSGIQYHLQLKFDRPIGGDIEQTKLERMDAKLTEVRFRFYSNLESGQRLKDELTSFFGVEPETTYLEANSKYLYFWYTENDVIKLVYQQDDENEDMWRAIYLSVKHKNK
ncbi:MAG: hypothetical protein IIX48_11465 [Lachnospiraceae bacterium]|nr:hypothetical protein [Lachnospiraceae bacterium]